MKIFVKVKPSAKQERLEKINENSFSVWVKEKPQEGRANQAVIKVLAEYFGIAKSNIVLLKGQTSKQKIFDVSSIIIGFLLIFILQGWFVLSASAGDGKEGDMGMKITSAAFKDGESIPSKFTCEGDDINPPLLINNIPAGTESLALIVDDPDAPMKTWVHWVLFDIPPSTNNIAEDSIPGKQGINDFRKTDYGGPCPPSGTHRYYFKLYALDKVLGLKEGITKSDLENAMAGHILAETELIGLYKKRGR